MHIVDVIFALLVIRSFDIKFSCWFSLGFVLFVHVFCSGMSLGKRKKKKTPVHLTYFVFLFLTLLHVIYSNLSAKPLDVLPACCCLPAQFYVEMCSCRFACLCSFLHVL